MVRVGEGVHTPLNRRVYVSYFTKTPIGTGVLRNVEPRPTLRGAAPMFLETFRARGLNNRTQSTCDNSSTQACRRSTYPLLLQQSNRPWRTHIFLWNASSQIPAVVVKTTGCPPPTSTADNLSPLFVLSTTRLFWEFESNRPPVRRGGTRLFVDHLVAIVVYPRTPKFSTQSTASNPSPLFKHARQKQSQRPPPPQRAPCCCDSRFCHSHTHGGARHRSYGT